MSQRTLERHYRPNRRLARAHGFAAFNCGFADGAPGATFADHQRALVWRLLNGAVIGPDSTVLDVGSGIGGPAQWIADRYRPRRIIGVEYCWSSVLAAAQRAERGTARLRFIQADAQRLPIADRSVDLVFNLESALHYPDKDRFLSECRRLLRPGGALCLGDIVTPYKRLFRLASLMTRLPTEFNADVTLWSSNDYERALGRCGMKLTHQEDITRPVADSLADGLAEVGKGGWSGSAGFRGRFLYLALLERLLRSEKLGYHLFRAVRPAD